MTKPTVVVAMSGGVDSSVAAALLKQQGYEVIGITLQIWPEDTPTEGQGCCSIDAVEDARRVASKLGVAHYVINMRDDFERAVIENFVDEYARGRTPNPCVRCNERVKFHSLLEKARTLGAEFLATGHYARIDRSDPASIRLLRAADHTKDQSYVLYMLGQDELASVMFPLGELTKVQSREIARDLGLDVWQKADSQEICFVGKSGYAEFITQRRPELSQSGPIVDTAGNVMGTHRGIVGFTVGQRKGIGVAGGRPLYVVDIEADTNTIVVGEPEDLLAEGVCVADVKWVSGRPPIDGGQMAVEAKVRYNMPNVSAIIRALTDDSLELVFSEPQKAPTPGQAAVCYDGEVVLGGGTISQALRDGRSANP